jgi:hypothetical protein
MHKNIFLVVGLSVQVVSFGMGVSGARSADGRELSIRERWQAAAHSADREAQAMTRIQRIAAQTEPVDWGAFDTQFVATALQQDPVDWHAEEVKRELKRDLSEKKKDYVVIDYNLEVNPQASNVHALARSVEGNPVYARSAFKMLVRLVQVDFLHEFYKKCYEEEKEEGQTFEEYLKEVHVLTRGLVALYGWGDDGIEQLDTLLPDADEPMIIFDRLVAKVQLAEQSFKEPPFMTAKKRHKRLQ